MIKNTKTPDSVWCTLSGVGTKRNVTNGTLDVPFIRQNSDTVNVKEVKKKSTA